MTSDERVRLGEERRLMFENWANGVDIAAIMVAFRRSREQVEREILFVAKKIREYRFRRTSEGSPHAGVMVACETLIDIRLYRFSLLDTLAKLGPLYLSSELLLPKISMQKIDHPSMAQEAAHRVNNA